MIHLRFGIYTACMAIGDEVAQPFVAVGSPYHGVDCDRCLDANQRALSPTFLADHMEHISKLTEITPNWGHKPGEPPKAPAIPEPIDV